MPHRIRDLTAPRGSDRRTLFRLGAGAAGAAGAGALALGSAPPAAAVISGGSYTSVTPERVYDSRAGDGPIRDGKTRRSTALAGSQYVCACALTVYNTTGKRGFLAVYSADLATRPAPYVSISWQGKDRVVTTTVLFDTGNSGFNVHCTGGSADYTLDFIGYFTGTAAKSADQLAFERRARQAARRLATG